MLTGWALAGRGIILKPVFEIADHLAAGALVPVAEATPAQDVQLACLYPHKRLQDPKSRLFIDFMVAACKTRARRDPRPPPRPRLTAAAPEITAAVAPEAANFRLAAPYRHRPVANAANCKQYRMP